MKSLLRTATLLSLIMTLPVMAEGDAEAGKAIAAVCAACHGIDGNSTDPRYPMLAGQEPEYLTKALQSYVGETRGSSTMHAMSAPLEAADVERIVAYYSTREPKSVVYMVMPCEEPTDD